MKKGLKIFLIIIALFIAAMIIVPYFFKDDILEMAKSEANKNLNAKVDFGEIDLSMFRDFPNLSVKINDITVSGVNEFKNETLVKIGSVGASVNLGSLFGSAIKTDEIFLENTYFNAIINKNGIANWDIVKTTDSKETTKEDKKSSSMPEVIFKNIRLENINVKFADHKEETYFSSNGININVSGNFSEENTNINFVMGTPDTNVEYGGIKYLNKAILSFEAQIAANLKEQIFKFKENKFKLNKMDFSINGSVDMNEEDMLIDVKMKTNNNDFKTLLSMIPGEFKKDLKDLKTSGKIQLSAYAKGRMTDKLLPGFGANLSVTNAQVQYPKLPESINNINILAKVSNAGGDIDNTIVDVNKFHLDIAKNPFDFNLNVKKPISDPELKGKIFGKIDFNKLKNAIPLEDANISGFVNANISFDGKMSHIEKKQYEKFKTNGKLTLNNFVFSGKATPKAVKIKKSVLAFSSRQISIQSFNATIGESDITLKGSIKNYIPYAIKDKTLIGDFSLSSNKLNLNELMPQTDKKEEVKTDENPMSVVEIPNNLKLKLNCNIKQMLYDKLVISNTRGLISVRNSKAMLNQLKMNLLKGHLNMNGEYNAQNIKAPTINFKLGANSIDINSAYKSFSIIKEMVPMAMNCSGKVSLGMDIRSTLNTQMEIIPTTLNGAGNISSKKILINKNKLLDGLATLTRDDSYKKISISSINMNVLIVNGNITLKPFTTKIAGNPAKIYGKQSVTGKIDYTIATSVEKKLLGKDINKTFNNVPGYKELKKIDIDLKIGGTLTKPTVKPDLRRTQKQIRKAAEKKLKSKVEKEAKKFLKNLF